ncbi:DMT family transporter [Pseudogracilibacillus auburnensis]|uniref:Drug/metabolite transporter (DMT)-like permease n=1 Tax=Pseudogracilibacillus auburnensis TaxID=1494959 RepID=A0A2V3VVA9_9BACI|nr:DMT family transporter [Pseudogracilibacillus auburnensis]PXW85580.1 drug/metabolite transporter (DMT)-like permease [Pseudogracilibacillus auburnensis]
MNKKIFIIAIITVIGWASGFAGIRASLLGGFSAGHLVLYRFLIASLIFLLYAIYPRSNFKLPKKKDFLLIFSLGIIGITFYHLGVTFGQETVSAGTASMIVGSAPIFTTLIAIFILKEKMEWFGWVGLGAGFIGICLITLGSTGATFTLSKGLLLVFFATISTSFFFVYQKPLFQRYHPIELTAYFTWAGTIPMLIYLPGLFHNIQHATLEGNLAAIYVGIVPAALCYATWAIALSLGNVSTLSSMLYLEPPIAIIIAWVWLNELPSVLSMTGGFIAISSVAIVNIIGHRKRRVEEGAS